MTATAIKRVPAAAETIRLRLHVSGCVQGVGFRPTVYRHATALGLTGWVRNAPDGVAIELEGESATVQAFRQRLRDDPPPQARIDRIGVHDAEPRGDTGFTIVPSDRAGELEAGMPPDLATCDACLADIRDPGNRRHGYAFTNCTDCGPRFTIVRALPYDRARTSMQTFDMCPACLSEYTDPGSRRFDAQPNACPVCGPELTLRNGQGQALARGSDALDALVERLRAGGVAAVKGLGGFHLCCDATSDPAVSTLRERKRRPHKPFAVMFADADQVGCHVCLSPAARAALCSAARPVVICPLAGARGLSSLLAPDTDDLGCLLPYTPLHHCLLSRIGPLVMTSANHSEEPIAPSFEALSDLRTAVVDVVLDHDRPVLRRCDDSVVRVCGDRVCPIRRSRGYVPQPVALPVTGSPTLAVGADLKGIFCVARGNKAFLSQHIGDLSELAAARFHREAIDDLEQLLGVRPRRIACDLHPDYCSTRYAEEREGVELVRVQHHHAHIAACLAEHGMTAPVIGVALDGTGWGPDGTVWGGEFLEADLCHARRLGRFAPFRLPGGDEAVRHPPRTALGWLRAALGKDADRGGRRLSLSEAQQRTLNTMITKGFRAPLTSSAGRLFDAVSALLGLCDVISYEGQAAIRLEALARRCGSPQAAYPTIVEPGDAGFDISFAPMCRAILRDLDHARPGAEIAAAFHQTIATAVVEACARIRAGGGLSVVALSGGVFQNDLLTHLVTLGLDASDFRVLTHRNVPCNDAGIALGQAAAAVARESINRSVSQPCA